MLQLKIECQVIREIINYKIQQLFLVSINYRFYSYKIDITHMCYNKVEIEMT